ncbi:MAG: Ig-like domain-containing protein [Gemmatimonadetes bacterium]|nr:Ig-like domain-containing protein [Gemmatimonadota bacterium]
MAIKRALRLTGFLIVTAISIVAACREVAVTAVEVVRVVVTPGTAQITIGNRMSFTVRIEGPGGRELERPVIWSTSAPAIAAVTSSGEVLALGTGTARITASSGGVTGEAMVTVMGRPVARVEIQPPVASVPVGDSARFQATTLDADGNVLTGRALAWSAGDPAIALVRDNGWTIGITTGSTLIAAVSEGIRAEATFSVRPAVVVGSVTVTPPTNTLPAGQTVQLLATVRTGDGTIINPPPPINWASGNAAIASVDGTGRVVALAPGTTNITATSGGQSGQATVTVTSTGVATVRIEPRSLSMVIATTFQLAVRAFDPGGAELLGRTVTWSALNPGVATVDPNGLVRAIVPGQGRIVASIEGITDTATIFVVQQPVATIAISPAAPTVLVNDSTLLQAILTDVNGAPLTSRFVTWSSSDTTIARIVSTGPTAQAARVFGRRAGSVTITAIADGRSATATLTVQASADLRVTKTGPAAVNAGDTIAWTLTLFNAGPSTASGVVLRDTLPANATFVSATGGATLAGNVLTWPTFANINAGNSDAFTVRAVAPSSGTVINVAAATSNTADANPADNRASITTSIGGADVSVTKTSPTQVVTAGDTITFTITVTNLGAGTAAGVVVTDSLPSNATFVSATGGPVQSGTLLTWPTIPSLGNGAATSYTVRVVAPASGSVTNVARVATASTDPNAANNRAAPTVGVNQLANLSITKTASPANPNAGDTLTYTIQVSNAGPSDATSVVVTDTLPPSSSATFVSASGGATLSGNVLTWPTSATLAAGGSVSYTVRVVIATSGAVTNVAAVTAATADGNLSDNRASHTTNVPASDIAITKTGPALVKPGDTITYTVQVSNQGGGTALLVLARDSLPVGATFVDATGNPSQSGTVLTWPVILIMPSGATQTHTVRVVAPVAASVTNVAWVSAATGDPNPSNNRSAVTTQIAQADLTVSKTGPASVNAGDIVSYTVTVNNIGTADATGVVVTDTLPSNAAFLDATGSPSQSGNVLSWPSQTIAASGSVSYTVRVTAPVTAATLRNAAAATTTATDANTGNNHSFVNTNVVPVADIQVTKSGPATVDAGGAISYSLTITNHGPSPAANVVLTDQLPGNAAFVSATGGAVPVSGVLTWNIGNLGAGNSNSQTVVVTAPAAGTVVNNASGTTSTGDPNGANNAAQTSTTVNGADIVVSKSGPASATSGTNITYTLSWVNNGPGPAIDVVLLDTLPAGVTFVSATGGPTQNAATNSLTWDPVPNRASGAPAVQHTVTVTVAATSGTLTNVAAASAATTDPNGGNNRATVNTTVLAPDLVVSKSGPATVGPGDTITYTLQVSNNGNAPAANVEVLDTLPSNRSAFVDAPGGTLSGEEVSFPVGNLAAGASSAVFTVRIVGPTAAAPATVVNVARAVSTSVDANPANNRASVTTNVVLADLSVSKSGPANALSGDIVWYVITTSNNGPSSASNVVVTDTLPAGTTLFAASRGAGESGGIVTWPALASLANGATRVDSVRVMLPTGGNARDAAAALSTTFDPDLSNNTADATTAITTATDMQVTKAVDKTNPVKDDTLTYTITVTNAGPVTAAGVMVVDSLPGNVTYVAFSATGNPVSVTSSSITWDLGSVGISSQTFTYKVVATSSGRVTNTVTVTSSTTEKNPADNKATVSITVP